MNNWHLFLLGIMAALKGKNLGPESKFFSFTGNLSWQLLTEFATKPSVIDKIVTFQELQELVSQEQSVIMQTSNALNQCCSGDSKFAGSVEQVECNRLLLVACKSA